MNRVGLITSEKSDVRAIKVVQNRATGGVVTKKKKVAKEDTDCFPYQD